MVFNKNKTLHQEPGFEVKVEITEILKLKHSFLCC